MKSKMKMLIFLGILCIFSCSKNEGHFHITNQSSFNIDSLSIMPDSKNQIIKLNTGQNVDVKIKMDEVKTDGSYLLTFRNSVTGEIISNAFGYYTNGYQVEDVINIKVLNDTIIIDSKFGKLY